MVKKERLSMKYETLEQAHTAGVAPWDLEVNRLSDFHVAVCQDRYPVARDTCCLCHNTIQMK